MWTGLQDVLDFTGECKMLEPHAANIRNTRKRPLDYFNLFSTPYVEFVLTQMERFRAWNEGTTTTPSQTSVTGKAGDSVAALAVRKPQQLRL